MSVYMVLAGLGGIAALSGYGIGEVNIFESLPGNCMFTLNTKGAHLVTNGFCHRLAVEKKYRETPLISFYSTH